MTVPEIDAAIDTWLAPMDPATGMYPEDWACHRCGRKLNADGGHPAELYAGTYTGLCYPCNARPAEVVGQRLIDGGVCWNLPPHCPSWRRDREPRTFFWDCPDCHGVGRRQPGSYGRTDCDTCSRRAYSVGAQSEHWRWRRRTRLAAEERLRRRLVALTGLPKRTSKKRQADAVAALDPELVEREKAAVVVAFHRVDALVSARARRRGTFRVLRPAEVIGALSAALGASRA